MEKNTLLKNLTETVFIDNDVKHKLDEFYKANNHLPDNDFYEQFNKTFPWIEYHLKLSSIWRLKRIDNHLMFFKVITIISIIVSIIIALSTIK